MFPTDISANVPADIKGRILGEIRMKLERINENQIRCTLYKKDLEENHIKISEFAYGSGRARELFQDLMRQAENELGFESEHMPLMIEAVPERNGNLVLLVTRVEVPDELDSRFSTFAHQASEIRGDEEDEDAYESVETVPFRGLAVPQNKKEKDAGEGDLELVYRFPSLTEVIRFVQHIPYGSQVESSLYKDSEDGTYELLFTGKMDSGDRDRWKAILNEYALPDQRGRKLYIEEHDEPVLQKEALETLRKI